MDTTLHIRAATSLQSALSAPQRELIGFLRRAAVLTVPYDVDTVLLHHVLQQEVALRDHTLIQALSLNAALLKARIRDLEEAELLAVDAPDTARGEDESSFLGGGRDWKQDSLGWVRIHPNAGKMVAWRLVQGLREAVRRDGAGTRGRELVNSARYRQKREELEAVVVGGGGRGGAQQTDVGMAKTRGGGPLLHPGGPLQGAEQAVPASSGFAGVGLGAEAGLVSAAEAMTHYVCEKRCGEKGLGGGGVKRYDELELFSSQGIGDFRCPDCGAPLVPEAELDQRGRSSSSSSGGIGGGLSTATFSTLEELEKRSLLFSFARVCGSLLCEYFGSELRPSNIKGLVLPRFPREKTSKARAGSEEIGSLEDHSSSPRKIVFRADDETMKVPWFLDIVSDEVAVMDVGSAESFVGIRDPGGEDAALLKLPEEVRSRVLAARRSKGDVVTTAVDRDVRERNRRRLKAIGRRAGVAAVGGTPGPHDGGSSERGEKIMEEIRKMVEEEVWFGNGKRKAKVKNITKQMEDAMTDEEYDVYFQRKHHCLGLLYGSDYHGKF